MKQTHALKSAIVAIFLASTSISTTALAAPSLEEMWKMIQQQQKELNALKKENKQLSEQVEVTSEIAEKASKAESGHGMGGRTTVGGYGELHYNNLEGKGGASDKDEIDLHRFILFLGHEFNDNIRFWSELEVEHGGVESDGDPLGGEVELEQAYLEFDLNDQHKARAGIILAPVGIINETHEPPTFYGTERNPVEKNIIPATWWFGGASLLGEIAPGWSYDIAIHEGLNTTAGNSYQPRNGRQKTSNAIAKDLAFTGRIKWTGMPGLELAASAQHQTDITQSNDTTAGSANLYEFHGIYNTGPFTVKALYAMWDLDGTGPASIGADEQDGWYIEPSYKINEKIGMFARYNVYDNAAGDSTASEKKQIDVGVNFWPHPDVVIKADYQDQDNDNGQNQSGFNLGVGYMF
jgi:hypothetical protein